MGDIILNLALSILIGSFIGWITNLIAVRALFHPQKKLNILGFEFQGLLPKRKPELANNLGNMVEGQLINIPELVAKVKPEDVDPLIDKLVDEHKEDIENVIKGYIDGLLKKIPFGANITTSTLVSKISDKVASELRIKAKEAMPTLLTKTGNEIVKHISIHQIVEEKVNAMNLDKLEAMVNKIADREMKMIEYMGAVLGALVGALQYGIQYIISIC